MTFYLAALAFSLVLIGVSAFSGHDHDGGDGDGHDHGGHDHVGHDHGGDVLHGPLGDVLSLRFLTWGLGGLGLTGSALTLLGVATPFRLPVSLGVGVVVGLGTTFLFRKLRTLTAGAPAAPESLLGQEAVVVMPLKPGALGKIRLRSGGSDVELLAQGGDDALLPADSRVVIVRFRDEVAEVRPAPWTDGE